MHSISSVLWLFLLAVAKGTELLWETLPGLTVAPTWYPAAVCTGYGMALLLFICFPLRMIFFRYLV